MTNNTDTVWCDRGWFPLYYGFCPSEKAWKKEMKKMGTESAPSYPDGDATCSWFEAPDSGKMSCLVTLQEKFDTYDPSTVFGLLVHEATHVWQILLEHIGEDKPSREFEAYSVQNITQNLFDAYCQTRNRTFKSVKTAKKVKK
jgi:hypothetical protein